MAQTTTLISVDDKDEDTEIDDDCLKDQDYVPETQEKIDSDYESDKNKTNTNSISKRKILHCPWSDCQKSFTKNIRLKTHIRMNHVGYTPFRCPECPDASFACRSYLNKHIKRKHSKEQTEKIPSKKPAKQFTCSDCTETFQTKIHLKVHRSKIHNEPYPFKCPECDQRFLYRSRLTTHQRRHRGYRCTYSDSCQFRTDKWTELRKHLAKQHKKIQCDICKKCYSSPYNLRIHQETVHCSENDHQSGPVFKCPVDGCNKEYNRRTSLKNHQRTVHADVNHQCQKCRQKFKHKKSLVAHMDRCGKSSEEMVKTKPLKNVNKKPITKAKLGKLIRIKPLFDEEQESKFLMEEEEEDSITRPDSMAKTMDVIDLEKISESNLITAMSASI